MSLLEKYIKRAAQAPLQRLTAEVQKRAATLEGRLENSINEAFTSALKKTGLSSNIVADLSARFGDTLRRDLSDKFFQVTSSAISRVLPGDIYDGMTPKFVETTSSATGSVNRSKEDKRISVSASKDVMQYPSHLGKYYMALKFRSYVRTAPQARPVAEFKNSIVLPIPQNIQEGFSTIINASNLGAAGAGADFFQALNQKGNNFDPGSQMGALVYNAAAAVGRSIFKKADTLGDVAGQYIKAIPNPHVAAIFNGVNLRQFHFTWTFAPRNPAESQELKRIINTLRQNSLPAFSSTGTAVLQYPFLCFAELHPWAGTPGDELIKFKPAFLTQIVINSSPNGIPSFFAGTDLPTFIKLDLTFLETEYFTSDDYGRTAAVSGDDADKIQQLLNITGIGNKGQEILDAAGLSGVIKNNGTPLENGTDAVNDRG